MAGPEELFAMQPKAPSAAHIRDVFTRYAAYMCGGDADAIAALFAEDAVMADPVGSIVLHGRQEIHAMFKAAFEAMGGRIKFEWLGPFRIAGDHGACAALGDSDTLAEPFLVETLDVARFNPDGLIVDFKAYYGPDNIKPYAR